MKPKAYLETSVVSYLTARASRDLIVAAHQKLTRVWWERRRKRFDLYCSHLVIQEAAGGDKGAARRRLEVLRPLPLLEITDAAGRLARDLVIEAPIPEKASEDALYIALATIHGMDYLLTWNCRHIANAEIRNAVAAVCGDRGYEPPVICTPEELMGE